MHQRLPWIPIAVVASLFILTQDYLFIRAWPNTTWQGLPVWLFYFIALHVMFVIVIWIIAIKRSDN